jgi:hypothetical protein
MGKFLSLGLVIGLMCVATTAQGQLVGLNELWNVPGVIHDTFGTVVECTNRTTATATIGVDIHGANGSYVCGGSITTAPDATVVFGSAAWPNHSVDVNQACGLVTKGHARIYSSAKSGILCSAFLVNSVNGSPVTKLTIAKKTKQKGD